MPTQRLNRSRNLIAIAALALSWLPAAPAAAAPLPAAPCATTQMSSAGPVVLPCGVGEVSGVIRGADTGLPLPNVGVIAAGFSYRTTTTDVNGHFAFDYQTANGPTPLTLAVTAPGHYVGVAQDTLFNVVSGTVTTMNFTLTVGSSLVGLVHATDVITPLEGVGVVLSPTVVPAGTPSTQRFAFTDASGAYQFLGLAPGSYKLKFDPTSTGALNSNLNKYIPSYWGGAADAASATVITVTAPATLTANIVLTPGATIAGDVLAADSGLGLKDYGAELFSPDNPELHAYAVRYFDTSSYAVQGLRPGHYRLLVYPTGLGGNSDSLPYLAQWYNNQISPTLASLITVTAITQTVEVTPTLQLGGVITGVVRDANTSQPIASAGIEVDSDVPSLSAPSLFFKTDANTDASGVYTATGLPTGHYLVNFINQLGVTAPYYDQVYNGHDVISSTVAGNLVSVTAPLTVTNINFALHPILTGTIAGRVTDNLGHGIQNVSVKITRTDSSSGLGRVNSYTDVNGYYTTTVPTATYFVEFSRDTTYLCGGCYNDQFFTAVGQSAPKAVLITQGSLVAGINATLLCGQAAPRRLMYLPLIRR